MQQKQSLVYAVDPVDYQKAQANFQPSIIVALPEINSIEDLVSVMNPHRNQDFRIADLEVLKATFLRAIENQQSLNLSESKRRKDYALKLAELRTSLSVKLKSIFDPNDNNETLNEIITQSQNLLPEKVEEFLDKIIYIAKREIKAARIKETTKKEFLRSVRIDGTLICTDPSKSVDELIAIFNDKMHPAHADIIDLLLEYLNQEYLIAAVNFFEKALDSGDSPIRSQASKDYYYDLTVESEDSVVINMHKRYYHVIRNTEYDDNGFPTNVYAEYNFQFKVTRTLTPEGQRRVMIEDVAGELHIYHPELREHFINKFKEKFDPIAKVHNNQSDLLNSNERRILTLAAAPLLLENGKINSDKVVTADKDDILFLMTQNLPVAVELLSGNCPPQFFRRRSVDTIVNDLQVVKSSHGDLPEISIKADQCITILEEIKSNDIKAIANKLVTNPEQVMMCLHTITNVGYIKKLLSHSEIKYNLNAQVLTHFALQDQSVAESLLAPSFWEKMQFNVRSYFGWTSKSSKLPHQRLESAHLTAIVKTHRSLWDTLFAEPKLPNRFFKFFTPKKEQLLQQIESPVIAGANTIQRKGQLLREIHDTQEALITEVDEQKIEQLEAKLGRLKPELDRTEASVVQIRSELNELNKTLIPDLQTVIASDDSYYRYKLNADDLKELCTAPSSAECNESYQSAMHNVLADGVLTRILEQKEKKDQTLVRLKDHPAVTFESLLQYYPVYWNKIHERLIVNPQDLDELELDELAEYQLQLESFYSAKIELEYNKNPETILNLIEDLWSDKVAGFHNNWVAMLPLEGKDILRNVILKFIVDKKFSYVDANGNISQRLLAEPFVTSARRIVPDGFRHNLQKSILSNASTFDSLFNISASNFAGSIDAKFFSAIVSNKHFLKLITTSPIVFDLIVELFKQPELKKLIKKANPTIETIIQNRPIFKDPTLAIAPILTLSTDAVFMENVAKMSGFAEAFAQMAINARVKDAIRKEPDHYLFKTIWKLLINKLQQERGSAAIKKNGNNLLELSALLPSDQFKQWLDARLDANHAECRFLIDKLIYDADFYQEFIKLYYSNPENEVKNADSIILILLNKAEDSELALLMLNCKEIGEVYLELIRNKAPNSSLGQRFAKFILDLPSEELVSLIAKYPNFLQRIDNNEELKKSLEKPIENALPVSKLVFKKEDLLPIQNLASKSEVGTDIINQLKDPAKHDNALVLLKDPEVIGVYLNHAKSNPSITSQLIEMLSLLKDNKFEQAFNDLLNLVVEKAIVDKGFRNSVYNNESDHLITLMNKFSNEALFVQFLMSEKVNLEKWDEGLTRIVAEKEVFERALPYFKKYPGFGVWLIRQDAKTRADIYRKHTQKNSELISEKEVEHYLARNQFKAQDLLIWLLEQYKSLKQVGSIPEGEPNLREILNKNSAALFYLCQNSSHLSSFLIRVFIEELSFDTNSTIVAQILTLPLLGHILESASNEDLRVFLLNFNKDVNGKLEAQEEDITITTRVRDQLPKDYAKIMKTLLHLFIQRSVVRDKLLSNDQIMSWCVDFAKNDNTVLSREFLISLYQSENLSHQLINETTIKTIRDNFQEATTQQTAELYLACLNHFLNANAEDKSLSFSIVEDLVLNANELRKVFSDDVNPKVQYQLLISLRRLLMLELSQPVKDNLFTVLKEDNSQALKRITSYLSADELIELLAVYGFDDMGEIALEAQDKMFRLSSEQSLCRLFSLDSNLAKVFIQKANMQEHRAHLSVRLTEQADATALHSSLIEKVDDYPNLFQLMEEEPEVHNKIIAALQKDEGRLLENGHVCKSYIDYLITHQQSEDLSKLVVATSRRFQNQDHPIINYFKFLLEQNDPENANLKTTLISFFGVVPHGAALIKAMLKHLSYSDLLNLLDNKNLDKHFVPYFENHPEDLETFFGKGNFTHLVNYFFYSPDQMRLYRVINAKLPNSVLIQHFDQGLRTRQPFEPFARSFLHKTDPAPLTGQELVDILKLEASRIHNEDDRTLSNIILKDKPLLQRILTTNLASLDDHLVNTDKIKATLNSYPELVEIYLNQFEMINGTLCFRGDANAARITYQHRLGYLYALNLKHQTKVKTILTQEKKGRILDECYKKYVDKVHNAGVALHHDGELYLKGSDISLPSEYALEYYKAHAAFFYGAIHSTKKHIEDKPKFAQAFRESVIIDVNGQMHFKDSAETPAMSYIHSVLYALCIQNNIIEILESNLSVCRAFIKSIQYLNVGSNSEIIFFGSEKAGVNRPEVPAKYKQAVTKAVAIIFEQLEQDFFNHAHHIGDLMRILDETQVNRLKEMIRNHVTGDPITQRLYFKNGADDEIPTEFLPVVKKAFKSQNPADATNNTFSLINQFLSQKEVTKLPKPSITEVDEAIYKDISNRQNFGTIFFCSARPTTRSLMIPDNMGDPNDSILGGGDSRQLQAVR